MFKLFLLGSPTLEVGGETISLTRRKAVALLAYLAMTQKPQTREALAPFLWPELDKSRGRAALRTLLSEIRSMPLSPYLAIDRSTVALVEREQIWVDVWDFCEKIEEVDILTMTESGPCSQYASKLKEATKLYRDDFLSGFTLTDSLAFDEWQRYQTDYLRFELIRSLEMLVTCYETQQLYTEGIPFTRLWLEHDPYHEEAHRALMRMLTHNGERHEAMRHYTYLLDLLQNELGIAPMQETQTLYEQIKNDDLAPPKPAPIGGIIGMAPRHPDLVVGRDDALAEVKARLGIGGERRPAIAIQGWPGLGKTTLAALLAHDEDVLTHFPDGILWTSLGETPHIKQIVADWAHALGMELPPSHSLEAMLGQLRGFLLQRKMLVIIDDVWELEHGVRLAIAGEQSATVYTTRFNDIAQQLATTAQDVYKLRVLPDDTAYALLGKVAPITVKQYPVAARELVADLEGLPLAIKVAGRLLHNEALMGWDLQDLINDLRNETHLLSAEAPAELHGGEAPITVAALLKKSTDRLPDDLRTSFAYLGVFAPKPATFDVPAIQAVWAADDPRGRIRELVNRGLLEPLGGGRFQMHALLAMHARSMFDDEQ